MREAVVNFNLCESYNRWVTRRVYQVNITSIIEVIFGQAFGQTETIKTALGTPYLLSLVFSIVTGTELESIFILGTQKHLIWSLI